MPENNLPYNAVMVDLETMSIKSNASIISIGAVRFWINVNQLEFTDDQLFYRTVSLKSCADVGLDIDPQTIIWWLQQSKEAQEALFSPPRIELRAALHELAAWIPSTASLFGNGATYDNVVLKHAFDACGIKYPVLYKNDLCYRTLARMSGMEPPKFIGTKHNALDDAIAQTRHMMIILEKTPWRGK